MPLSHPHSHLPLYVLTNQIPRPIGPPPSYDEAHSRLMFSKFFSSFLIIVQTFAPLIIFLTFSGPSYEINRVNNSTFKSIQTSEKDKIPFQQESLPRKIFTFCILVSVFSKTVPETYIIPCYFCEAKFFKILLSQLPEFCSHPTN